jgi:hypothetical protein
METQTLLVVPRGDPSLGTLNLEMEFVYWAENRISEVATVNPHKAPELLAVFNKAWSELGKLRTKLKMELGTAQQQVNLRRGQVLLDEADGVLKGKGLATSKDLREAVVEVDSKFQELSARLHTLQVYEEWLEVKSKSLEMAYTSVKKILGERPGLGGGSTAYPHHNGNQSTPAGGNENSIPSGPKGFGGAKI